MYTVYVLQDSEGGLYKGMTSNINRRLAEHAHGKTRTTRRMTGLKLVHSESFDEVTEARKREVYFKTAAGRRYLKTKFLGG